MKRTLASLVAFVILFTLTLSANAANRSDLERVHQKLTQYFYLPFYEESQYYETYVQEMENSKLLLEDTTATDEEMDKQYERLKDAYAKITLDSFDYSSITNLYDDYKKLNPDLFTQDSIKLLADVSDKIFDQIEAPTLYKRQNRNKKEYYEQYIKKLIDPIAAEFRTAFNNLQLKDLTEENITKSDLEGLLVYCNLCAQESIFSTSSEWEAYQSIASEIRTSLESDGNTPINHFKNANELLDAYKALTSSYLNLAKAKEEAKTIQSLNRYDYTEASWKSYEATAKEFADFLQKPVFLYLKYLNDNVDFSDHANRFIEEKTQAVAEKRNQLVLQEQINKLSALCNTYHHTTSIEGLDAKVQLLLDRVDQGYQVLRNENANKQEVDAAISNIEEAADTLRLAEVYMLQEQNEQTENDVQTIRLTILFTVVSFALSLVFTFILYSRQTRKMQNL